LLTFLFSTPPPPRPPLFPYTTLFRSDSTTPTALTATQALSLTVNPTPVPVPLAITTTSLPAGTVSSPYSATLAATGGKSPYTWRSEEHTSELQSRENLVCRLLLEKKK